MAEHGDDWRKRPGTHYRTIRGRMICQCVCDECFRDDPWACACPGCQCRTPEDHDA
jgi:hypothetical protein